MFERLLPPCVSDLLLRSAPRHTESSIEVHARYVAASQAHPMFLPEMQAVGNLKVALKDTLHPLAMLHPSHCIFATGRIGLARERGSRLPALEAVQASWAGRYRGREAWAASDFERGSQPALCQSRAYRVYLHVEKAQTLSTLSTSGFGSTRSSH